MSLESAIKDLTEATKAQSELIQKFLATSAEYLGGGAAKAGKPTPAKEKATPVATSESSKAATPEAQPAVAQLGEADVRAAIDRFFGAGKAKTDLTAIFTDLGVTRGGELKTQDQITRFIAAIDKVLA